MGRVDWSEVIREAYDNSLKLGIPAVRRDDTYVIYSVACLTALRFGRLLAIDAGAGAGFSTVWIAKALYESGVEGVIHAVEKDSERFSKLKELVDRHDLKHLITPINNDALEHVLNVENGLNLVFMDIEKEHYLEFFRRVRDKVSKGGVFLAHNVKRHRGTIGAFLMEASKNCWKTIIVPTEEGVSISVKTV